MDRVRALRLLVATFLGLGVGLGIINVTQAEAVENVLAAVAVAAGTFGAAELLPSKDQRG